MQATNLLKYFILFVLILEISSAPENGGGEETEQEKQPISKVNPQVSVVPDDDKGVDETQEQRELANQKKNIQRHEDLEEPTVTKGVAMVKPEIQKPAEEGQKTKGTTAHIDVENIVQNQLQKMFDKNKDEQEVANGS